MTSRGSTNFVLDVAGRFDPKLIGSGLAKLWIVHEQKLLSSACTECPITLEPIKYPALLCDGDVFEESAISQWLEKNNTAPCTNLGLLFFMSKKKVWFIIKDMDPLIHGSAAGVAARAAAGAAAGAAACAAAVRIY